MDIEFSIQDISHVLGIEDMVPCLRHISWLYDTICKPFLSPLSTCYESCLYAMILLSSSAERSVYDQPHMRSKLGEDQMDYAGCASCLGCFCILLAQLLTQTSVIEFCVMNRGFGAFPILSAKEAVALTHLSALVPSTDHLLHYHLEMIAHHVQPCHH